MALKALTRINNLKYLFLTLKSITKDTVSLCKGQDLQSFVCGFSFFLLYGGYFVRRLIYAIQNRPRDPISGESDFVVCF